MYPNVRLANNQLARVYTFAGHWHVITNGHHLTMTIEQVATWLCEEDAELLDVKKP